MRSRPITFALVAPVLALLLLGGIAMERRDYIKPEDVEKYHADARTAIEGIPWTFDGGQWNGIDIPLTPAAQKLLKLNAYVSRRYDKKPHDGGRDMSAQLLIVQCRDSRDMVGHYPPVCYPAHGLTPDGQNRRQWNVGGLKIDGIEYSFVQRISGQSQQTIVYDFFVVPDSQGTAIKPDMDAVRAAAESYQQRYYGAAQFQVVFEGPGSADLSGAERDEVFVTLIEPLVPVIQTLASGGLQ